MTDPQTRMSTPADQLPGQQASLVKVGTLAEPDALRILNLDHVALQVLNHGVPMHGAPARGLPLHSNGHLGADLVYVRAGDQFPVHTHPGDHLLLSVGGRGTITVGDTTYDVRPMDIYMVAGEVPHAVGASADAHHLLIAIGAPHKPVDAPDRMTWTDWLGQAVDAPLLPTSAALDSGAWRTAFAAGVDQPADACPPVCADRCASTGHGGCPPGR